MIRKIIRIDEEACSGCGLCVTACHEGAIALVDGKARLMREDFCDGLGDCLPACPEGAITFEEREAAEYDEEAVKKSRGSGGCPGQRITYRKPAVLDGPGADPENASDPGAGRTGGAEAPSRLSQWPVQIKLVPVKAPFFRGAELLVAADCTAYAYAGFHEQFIKGRITLVGCPKLDGEDYGEKLGQIIRQNDIRSVTVVRMEVPCCGGLEQAVRRALENSGKYLPWQVVTISADGKILER